MIWETPGGKQIATPGFKKMIGYNLADGAEVWHVDGMPSACLHNARDGGWQAVLCRLVAGRSVGQGF